jgi:putative FmdB family regulatory protein
MPLYEYECDACGRRFEVIQKYSDAHVEKCEACGRGPVRRLLSSPAIQFKGSGWYITDYAQKGKSDPARTSAEKSEATEKTDKTETKTESKTEKKGDTASPAPPSTPSSATKS